MAADVAYNLCQILVVLLLSPLVRGILTRMQERIQAKRGPSIWQPYYDLWKLFHKDEVVSNEATWIFRFAPYAYFVAPLLVTVLIPVLTDYPLFMAFMGDMVAAGFILSMGSFFLSLAAIDTGNVYGPMGASRTRMVSSLVEPIFMIVFFSVSFAANSTIPYVVQAHWVSSSRQFFSPTHLLIITAFVMIILAETGRIPVDNPGGHFELAMIDEAKSLEFSGPSLALIKWGGYMKFMVLSLVLLNVLVTPWGLATHTQFLDVVASVFRVGAKLLAFVMVVAVIETSLAKLRLYRIQDFLGVAFVTAVVAMIVQPFHL
ncbi:MAG: NADH-quinone oxidoreductase subunit H [Thermaerobacter sp.]|nr:NADH-quinone oxidoreductase subunit H [Thermaerobacter sp.]